MENYYRPGEVVVYTGTYQGTLLVGGVYHQVPDQTCRSSRGERFPPPNPGDGNMSHWYGPL